MDRVVVRRKQQKIDSTKADEAIAAWRAKGLEPDGFAKDVVGRLTKDRRAAEAFAILNLPSELAAIVVSDCIKAELNARTFMVRLAREAAIQKLLRTADDGLKACAELLAQATGPRDALQAFVTFNEGEPQALLRGLNDWKSFIDGRRRIAQETPGRVGATRKRTGKHLQAGQRAAIYWIADGVRRLAKRPHYDAVGMLAEVVLELPTSIDATQVRAVCRGRNEWRIGRKKFD